MRQFFDFLKNLHIVVKVTMCVMMLAVILFVAGIASLNGPLIIVALVIFVIGAGVAFIAFAVTNKEGANSGDRAIKKVVALVKTTDSIEVKEISKKLSIPESKVRNILFECVKQNLIEDYTVKGDKVERNDIIEAQKDNSEVVKCAGCGATFASNLKIKKCPYCGLISKE